MKVCICGGGSLGHVMAGVLSSKGLEVNILTGRPKEWEKELEIFLPDTNKTIKGKLNKVSSDPKIVIPHMDYIFLCLPGFLIADTLKKIEPFLSEKSIIGSVVSSNGYFWMVKSILPPENSFFGFQRVPYIARYKEYGASAYLKGYKTHLKASILNSKDKKKIQEDLFNFFDTPVEILESIWPAALTNSNPILHTARLYSLFKDYSKDQLPYKEEPLFYEEWDINSSEILIQCDNEFQAIIKELPFNQDEIPTLLQYYESKDATSLTMKLQSIKAFKGIRLKMKKRNGGYIPDWEDRYFSEDIPYGLLIIKGIAQEVKIKTPTIDAIILWAQKNMGKEYLINGKLQGKDILETGIASNFVKSIDEITQLN